MVKSELVNQQLRRLREQKQMYQASKDAAEAAIASGVAASNYQQMVDGILAIADYNNMLDRLNDSILLLQTLDDAYDPSIEKADTLFADIMAKYTSNGGKVTKDMIDDAIKIRRLLRSW